MAGEGEEFDRHESEQPTMVAAEDGTRVIPGSTEEDASCSTGTCGPAESRPMAEPGYVYAVGSLSPRFPSVSVEKEFHQAAGNLGSSGLTDTQALKQALSDPANRYIARNMCWVFTIDGVDTYLILLRDQMDLDLLLGSLRANSDAGDMDVLIGMKGPISPPSLCGGIMVPMVNVSQFYSFDRKSLIKSLPKPKGVNQSAFEHAAEEILDRVLFIVDNAGSSDEHRALNYLAMRYSAIYEQVAEAFGKDFSLSGVQVRRSRLDESRKVMDVIFTFTHRKTDVQESHFVKVDVTEEFPFLVKKISPYFEVSA